MHTAPGAPAPARISRGPAALDPRPRPRTAPASARIAEHARLLARWRAAQGRAGAPAALDAVVAAMAADAACAVAAGAADCIADVAAHSACHAQRAVRALGAENWALVRARLEARRAPTDLVFSLLAAALPEEGAGRAAGAPTPDMLRWAPYEGPPGFAVIARAALNLVSGDADAQGCASLALQVAQALVGASDAHLYDPPT